MDSNLDILITRVVDGVAAPADWDSLEALAAADPTVWRELAQAQRAEQLLKGAAAEAVAPAARVELPTVIAKVGEDGLRLRLRRVGTWGGWAAAAVVTLAFFGKGAPANSGVQPADLSSPIRSAADFYQQYLDQGKKEGRVIGELPDRVLMDAEQAQDGKGYTVVFVRQIMERTKVDSLSQISHDEEGKPCLAPARMYVAKGPGNGL
jgi:hypothetical protein